MRAAVLLYGVLNTFESIYLDPELREKTIPGCLEANNIPYDVFTSTENKGFFKNFAPSAFDGRSIHGLDFIGVSQNNYYHVAEYPASRLRDALAKAFGDRVRDVSIDETTFDNAIWGSPQMYAHMIRTFFKRKLRAYSMMCEYAAKNEVTYDVVFIVRPDSYMRLRGKRNSKSSQVHSAFTADFNDFGASRNNFWVDQGAFTFSGNELAIIKNDFAWGDVDTMGRFLSIAELIDTKGGGNFRKLYPRRAIRDAGTMALSVLDGSAASSERKENVVEVTLWPEYKMHEHLLELKIPYKYASVTGGVVR